MTKYFILLFLLFPLSVQAKCFGSGSYKTCYDNNGNTYEIMKFGNTTEVTGHNSRTGSQWSETVNQFGNTTTISGRDHRGNTWNEDIQRFGNTTSYSGRDSDGNSFHKTCYRNFDGTQTCY
ncbi:MAG: hypothetical protein MJ250_07675 [Alphaproteobacteria bacterium]|nr:hypothetical protein [Alphaproteobacteria bacterium]